MALLLAAIPMPLLVLASFSPAAAPMLCPAEPTLQQGCGRARRSTVGDCLICMAGKFSGCTAADAERFCSSATAPRLVVQNGRVVSLLDPLKGELTALGTFGADWTNTGGSSGLGCNATHCISMGSFAMSPSCIGIIEKAAPARMHAVPLSFAGASFSAPAFVSSAQEWQVVDASGNLFSIDDSSLSLHKKAAASSFFPPYYYHAAVVPTHTLPTHALWCALGSDRKIGQVIGCFDGSTMDAEGVINASFCATLYSKRSFC